MFSSTSMVAGLRETRSFVSRSLAGFSAAFGVVVLAVLLVFVVQFDPQIRDHNLAKLTTEVKELRKFVDAPVTMSVPGDDELITTQFYDREDGVYHRWTTDKAWEKLQYYLSFQVNVAGSCRGSIYQFGDSVFELSHGHVHDRDVYAKAVCTFDLTQYPADHPRARELLDDLEKRLSVYFGF